MRKNINYIAAHEPYVFQETGLLDKRECLEAAGVGAVKGGTPRDSAGAGGGDGRGDRACSDRLFQRRAAECLPCTVCEWWWQTISETQIKAHRHSKYTPEQGPPAYTLNRAQNPLHMHSLRASPR